MEKYIFNNYKLKLNMSLYRQWQNRISHYLKLIHVRASGVEKISTNGPAIIAPNHLDWKDIPLVAAMIRRPISFAATFKLFDKKICYKWLNEYFEKYYHHPMLKEFIHRFNEFLAKFLVERVPRVGAFPAKVDSFIETAKSVLHQNKLVCVFPEGGFGLPNQPRRFKLGIAKILYDFYIESQKSIPAFPVAIKGTQKICCPGMSVGFHVGSPLYIEAFIQPSERETLLNFVEELRNSVLKLIKQD